MEQFPMKEKEPPHPTRSALKQRALERWENEGGVVPNVPTPRPGEMSPGTTPVKDKSSAKGGADDKR